MAVRGKHPSVPGERQSRRTPAGTLSELYDTRTSARWASRLKAPATRGKRRGSAKEFERLNGATISTVSRSTPVSPLPSIEPLAHNSTGEDNVASGADALFENLTGEGNAALGYRAGALVHASHNIDISNEGLAADSGTTRIGTEGKQTRAYVAGVSSTAVKGCAVQVTTEGQLGCNNNPEGSAVATYASTAGVPTGECLYFLGRATPGKIACPAATSGYSASKALSLAMPANGATVSNLYAETSATVTGSDTAVVEAIDNNTSAVLLKCTVNSTTVNHCTNNTQTGALGAGDKLEVKITTTGTSGATKDWEVTFRY
jgi:trimeric autotransporter adhesin